ncbi:hypothetical protein ACH4E7_41645 [Kitasatospora sp. NPDC018058]|uniref:hypothetical protein n=1 Tax=Kitasatospora sp. NPDC018058 TaxID=3364025 RepID=UPI0037C052E2
MSSSRPQRGPEDSQRGSATDVPGLLRRCAGPDLQDAGAAAGALDNALFHQGCRICSAARPFLPLAARTEVPTRVDLLEPMTELSTAARHVAANRAAVTELVIAATPPTDPRAAL